MAQNLTSPWILKDIIIKIIDDRSAAVYLNDNSPFIVRNESVQTVLLRQIKNKRSETDPLHLTTKCNFESHERI